MQNAMKELGFTHLDLLPLEKLPLEAIKIPDQFLEDPRIYLIMKKDFHEMKRRERVLRLLKESRAGSNNLNTSYQHELSKTFSLERGTGKLEKVKQQAKKELDYLIKVEEQRLQEKIVRAH